MEDYLTPEEAAEILKVKKTTIWNWLRTGKLKGIKTGKIWRIRRDDLEEFLNKGSFKLETEQERIIRFNKLRAKLLSCGETIVEEHEVYNNESGNMELEFKTTSLKLYVTMDNSLYELKEIKLE